jgi:hypothetical protein
MAEQFDYKEAFRINSGVLSPLDQEKLKKARVTIVGTGGAGGAIAVMMARSGVERFNLIDFDTYSLSNINRQIGCFMDTLGKYKSEVIKDEILRINPEAQVHVFTRKLEMDELDKILDETDVYFSEADDLAYSTCSLVLAQEKGKFAITHMPSGMTAFIMAFPPDLKKIHDPTHLCGGPRGLKYEAMREFQRDATNRSGRRWHITQGKMRISWFRKWCRGEATLTQLCPAVWLGASVACLEAVKYITGRWQSVAAPKIWQLDMAENRLKVVRFRRRTWLFSKYIYWALGVKRFGFGNKLKAATLKSLNKDLGRMEQEESRGESARLPFMWKHVI